MSTGGLVGALVGGVAGFFMGGPVGAVYGASLGYSIGSIIDPITPDIETPGLPKSEGVVMLSTIGEPLPDLLGTGQITGHLLCYGKERVVTLTEEVEVATGGKGGGGSETQTQVTGYNYYMTWAVGICVGPVTTLLTVLKNEEVVWEGTLNCPATGGQETITLEGMGSCTFYFGTNDQVANSTVAELIPDSTLNTPYRNFCWALMDDCIIGEYSSRTPTMRFIVSKHPIYSFSSKEVIMEYDYNPIHAQWHILNNLCGLPSTWLSTSAFASAASTMDSEYMGISMVMSTNSSALDYLSSINSHIDSVLRYDSEGTFSPKLIRDDYDVGSVPSIDESVLLEEPDVSRSSWLGTHNEVKVQYSELINITRIKEALAGVLLAAGNNQYKNMDFYDLDSRYYFSLCSFVYEWRAVDGGEDHTIGIKKDGTLWGWGRDTDGQLGVNGSTYVYPTQLMEGKFIKIFAVYDMSMALKNDYTLWATGKQSAGQFGIGNKNTQFSWIQISSGIESFGLGAHCTLVTTGGEVWAAGDNASGGLGTQDYTESLYFTEIFKKRIPPLYEDIRFNATDVAVGMGHTILTAGDGYYGVGQNTDGQLGLGDWTNRSAFEELDIDGGTVYVNKGGNNTFVLGPLNIKGCGWNSSWQLGQGTTASSNTFIELITGSFQNIICERYKTILHGTDGTVWATGIQNSGEFGVGHTTAFHSFAQIADDSTDNINVFSGSAWVYLSKDLTVLGDILCATGNITAILPTTRKEALVPIPVKGVAYSFYHFGNDSSYHAPCIHIIDSTKRLYGFGNSSNYELGAGNKTSRYELTRIGSDYWKNVSNCYNWTLGIHTDGTLWGVGYNYQYQLGLGDKTTRQNFTQLDTETDWASTCGGHYHSLALKNNGEVWGAGENSTGELGCADNADKHYWTKSTISEDVVYIAAGAAYSICLDSSGNLYGTGYGVQGVFGIGNSSYNQFTLILTGVRSVSCGSIHTMAVKLDGTLWCCGSNSSGQLGLGYTGGAYVKTWTQVGSGTNWYDVNCGEYTTIVLNNDGTIWGTGQNAYGQLGDGTVINPRNSLTQEVTNKTWSKIAASQSTTLAIEDN
jgi:alpha-tubulin suppressor-like RCC1 family protein